MTAPIETLIQIGVDVLSTIVDKVNNRVLAYLGDVKAQQGDSDAAQWMQHVGWCSLPSLPVAGKSAAQCVTVRRSDSDFVIASQDSRSLMMYGGIGPGEFCAFAAGANGTSQGRILGKTDGSVQLYTRQGNAAGGNGMVVQLDAANNAFRALNGLGFGIIADANGVTITSGAASLTLGQDGSVTLVGTAKVQVDGPSVVLGSLVAPGVNSAVHGPTGLAAIASLKVLIE